MTMKRPERDWRSIGSDEFWDVADVRYLGFWHSHPSGVATPSPADLRAFVRTFESLKGRYGASQAVYLVVTPDPSGDWARPRFAAFYVKPHERLRGDLVTERAVLAK
jgi:proteasome lid subunit RPN8/RPN11